MATPRDPAPTVPRAPRRRRRLLWLVILAGAIGAIAYGRTLVPRAKLATAYGARIGCACHFVGGRPLGECRRDFEPGMGLVMLSADPAAGSVTARIPLFASQTATFRPGPGCQLDRWTD